MSRLEDHIVSTIKPFIHAGKLEELQQLWIEYRDHTEFPREIAWDYVFQKVYLHAALHKQKPICEWLQEVFLEFDLILQIHMRPIFAYAKTLLREE